MEPHLRVEARSFYGLCRAIESHHIHSRSLELLQKPFEEGSADSLSPVLGNHGQQFDVGDLSRLPSFQNLFGYVLQLPVCEANYFPFVLRNPESPGNLAAFLKSDSRVTESKDAYLTAISRTLSKSSFLNIRMFNGREMMSPVISTRGAARRTEGCPLSNCLSALYRKATLR